MEITKLIILDLPDPARTEENILFTVDLDENNIVTMSSGKLISKGKILYERDKFLARRRRLQSNGSRSSKRVLKRISGKENRRIKNENHKISKTVIEEAVKYEASQIVLEDLTNIRMKIRAKQRERTRLDRGRF